MKIPKVAPSFTDKVHLKTKERIGSWTVLYETEPSMNSSNKKVRYYACKCDCGTVRSVRMLDLRHGKSKHCGCKQAEQARHANTTHGFRKTPLHQIYRNMLNRCNNKKDKRYKNYGGRGIKVCRAWQEGGLAVFGEWCMENGYKKGLQLDRRNNDKGYSPKNCRFISRKKNMNNTSRNAYVMHKGKKYTFKGLWEKYGTGVKYGTALSRYRDYGYSAYEAVTIPLRYYSYLIPPSERKSKKKKRLVTFRRKAA